MFWASNFNISADQSLMHHIQIEPTANLKSNSDKAKRREHLRKHSEAVQMLGVTLHEFYLLHKFLLGYRHNMRLLVK
jgi:hypothetical protein